MKYAIILETFSGDRYLTGFTNTPIDLSGKSSKTYTVELREISTMFILLEGDAKIYLS